MRRVSQLPFFEVKFRLHVGGGIHDAQLQHFGIVVLVDGHCRTAFIFAVIRPLAGEYGGNFVTAGFQVAGDGAVGDGDIAGVVKAAAFNRCLAARDQVLAGAVVVEPVALADRTTRRDPPLRPGVGFSPSSS